nr:protein phytochrome kinase substrate 3-like [Tanacetum cinerariifolium]
MGSESPNDLRVGSFSCYHKPIEGVIDMFDASDQKFSDMTVLDLHRLKPSMFTARTPSTASEASGWSNNQWALLQQSTPSRPKLSGRAFRMRWFNTCTGPCSTKKDVYVHQSVKNGDQFAFPVLNEEKVEERPRLSIEVFGSGNINKSDIAKNLVRKMSILTWDAIPKSKESVICDDMASEASSDLFEIENITKTEWQPCAMSPPTQYAPSESSIEWSVVTASAAEFASVYSYDEKSTVYKTKIEPMKKPQKLTLANGLLGCMSNNSVKVAEPVYRATNKSKH